MADRDTEKRLKQLETEVETLRQKVDSLSSDKPWWERIAGTFSESTAYEKAMKLGREYRKSQKAGG
ncbi:MAG: hypothetical protein IT423_22940 [Pirellulaceae bacterium]|nr:hypothetical protein [Pirellulaceae bacterium]